MAADGFNHRLHRSGASFSAAPSPSATPVGLRPTGYFSAPPLLHIRLSSGPVYPRRIDASQIAVLEVPHHATGLRPRPHCRYRSRRRRRRSAGASTATGLPGRVPRPAVARWATAQVRKYHLASLSAVHDGVAISARQPVVRSGTIMDAAQTHLRTTAHAGTHLIYDPADEGGKASFNDFVPSATGS